MLKINSFDSRQYMKTDDYELFYYHDKYLKNVALHHHDFYELYFFISGKISYIIENRTYNLIPGDILLISPKELHQPIFHSSQSPYERIVIWINTKMLNHILVSCNCDLTQCFNINDYNHTNLIRLDSDKSKDLFKQAKTVINRDKSENSIQNLQSAVTIINILITINKLYNEIEQNYEIYDPFSDTLKSIMLYINSNLDKHISLELLAQKHFISKYHLCHEFKRLVGSSVYRYIIQRRLIFSKTLLNNGIKPQSVFKPCGFNDYSCFYRAFKTEYGISPLQYAKENKQ